MAAGERHGALSIAQRVGEIIEHPGLLENLLGAPGGPPALDRSPIGRPHQINSLEAGVLDDPSAGPHVDRMLRTNQHHTNDGH